MEQPLIDTIKTGTEFEREDAFAQLLFLPNVQGMIRRLTKKFEDRGLYDAESIIYEWLVAKCTGAVVAGRTVAPFEEGRTIASYSKEITSILQDAVTQARGRGVSSTQYGRYSSVAKELDEQQVNLDVLLKKYKISKSEFYAIRTVDSGTLDIAKVVTEAPSLDGVERDEIDTILAISDEVWTDHEKEVIHYRHFHDAYSDLSDARVAEELARDDADKLVTPKTIERHRKGALQKVRDHIGLAV